MALKIAVKTSRDVFSTAAFYVTGKSRKIRLVDVLLIYKLLFGPNEIFLISYSRRYMTSFSKSFDLKPRVYAIVVSVAVLRSLLGDFRFATATKF